MASGSVGRHPRRCWVSPFPLVECPKLLIKMRCCKKKSGFFPRLSTGDPRSKPLSPNDISKIPEP